MDKPAPSLLKATAIGGVSAGFVSALPVIGALNCLCCCLIIGGGFLAAFLYSRDCEQAGAEFRPGQGALVGLVAGLFYAVTSAIVGTLVRVVMPPPDIDQLAEQLDQFDLPPEVVDQVLGFLDQDAGVMMFVVGLGISLVTGLVFSTIGGLIGGAAFKKEAALPPPAPTGSTPPPAV
jgi:hypothetical protein